MIASDCVIAWGEVNIILSACIQRECKGYISFNRCVNEFNRGVNELNRGVNDLNRGVNHSVARQGCNLLRAAVTSAVTSQGCCCGNLSKSIPWILDIQSFRCGATTIAKVSIFST